MQLKLAVCLGFALLAVGAVAGGDKVVKLGASDFEESVADGKVRQLGLEIPDGRFAEAFF
jgi:hypothetical protein